MALQLVQGYFLSSCSIFAIFFFFFFCKRSYHNKFIQSIDETLTGATLQITVDLEPRHQMQFHIVSRSPLFFWWEEDLTPLQEYSQRILSPTDRIVVEERFRDKYPFKKKQNKKIQCFFCDFKFFIYLFIYLFISSSSSSSL